MKKSKFLGLLVLLILCVFSIYGLVGCTTQTPQFNSSSNPTFSSVGDNTSNENSENISSSINSENTSSSQESSQHSHVYKNYVYNNDATCTEDGTETGTCSCGDKYTRTSVGSARHLFGNEQARVEPTCTTTGTLAHYKCSRCEKYFNTNKVEISSIVIAKLSHKQGSAVEENRVESTCTKAGSYDLVIYCSYGCKTELSRNKKTLALAEHIAGTAVEENIVNSTCTKAGSYDSVVYCTNSGCGAEISRTNKTIAKLDHVSGTAVEENKVASTCTKAGSYDSVVYCSYDCGTEISRTKKTLALASHNYGTQVAAKAATCTADGNVAHYKCSRCSQYFDTNKNQISTITITKLGHNYGNQVAAKAATCTAAGNIAYYKCSSCSKYFNSSKTEVSSVTVAAKGHSYDVNKAQVNAGAFTSGTIAYKHCSSCNKTFNSSGTDITGQSLYIAPTSGFKTVKGSFSKGSGQIITTATSGSIALYAGVESVSKTSASLSVRINHNPGPIGLVFNYTDANNYYKFIIDDTTTRYDWGEDKVRLIRVQNGTETEIYSNYLSAGYWSGNTNGGEGGDPFTFRVVIKDNVAYCYFWKTLYITQSLTFSGSGIGIYSGTSSSITFNSYTYSNTGTVDTCNTLLFGHSYFEMWRKWQSDFTTISNNCSGFGTFIDIGIGGSVAEHWYNMREYLLKYNFNNVVFMIGINDISGAYSPSQTFNYVKKTLDYLKQQKPNMKAVLVGVAQCPARDYIKNKVSELNVLYKQYSLENSWINYAEVEWLFTDSNGYIYSDFLDDNLHPSDSAYTNKLGPAIQKAWNGGYQTDILNHLKYIKTSSLDIYGQNAYREHEWAIAKPIYNEMINRINSCSTYSELQSLNIDSWLGNLNNIFTHSDYAFYSILESSHSTTHSNGSTYSFALWEDTGFTSTLESSYGNKTNPATSPSKYNLGNYGHRLDTSVNYTDMTFTFSFSNGPTNNEAGKDHVARTAILFHATQRVDSQGLDAYAIGYVKDAEGDGTDYFQILHFKNCYAEDGSASACTYLGGWVYKGNAENKTFRAVISGNICYIYEESTYQTYGNGAWGCFAFLDANGVIPYTNGYWGLLNWGNQTSSVTVDNMTGDAIHMNSVAEAHNATYNLSSDTNCATYGGNFGNGAGAYVTALGKGFRIDTKTAHTNARVTFSVESDTDIENAGVLLKANINTAKTGVTGYLITPTAMGTNNSLLVWKLIDAGGTSEHGTSYNQLANWALPFNPRGVKFSVTLYDNKICIATEDYNWYANLNDITYGGQHTLLGSGYVGVFANSGYTGYVKIHNLSCDLEHGTYAQIWNDAIANDINTFGFRPDWQWKNGNSIHMINTTAKIYQGMPLQNFSMKFKMTANNYIGVGGIIIRAKKSYNNTGFDGYLLNYVHNQNGEELIQIIWVKNHLATDGISASEWVWIDQWSYPAGVMGTEFTVDVTEFNITLYANGTNLGTKAFDAGNPGWTGAIHKTGGIGTFLQHDGVQADVTISEITPK